MPIEFRCEQCSKLLRTPDESAGRQAKCPECGAINTIPSASQSGGQPSAAGGAGQGGSFGPPPGWAPQDAGPTPEQRSAGQPMSPGELGHAAIDVNEVFSQAWSIFKQQWGICLGLIVVAGLVNMIPGILVQGLAQTMQQGPALALATMVINIGGFVLQTWITVGQMLAFLRIARGQPVELGMLFQGGPWLARALGGNILFGLMVGLGMLLCVVPGVILALMFWPYLLLIVDRNMGVIESLDRAREITRGNWAPVFLMALAMFGLSILGLLACFVGIFVVGAFGALLYVVAYLQMTAQPVIQLD